MEIFTGGKTEEITGHSNNRVLKHYRVSQLIAKAAREFEVYPKENELAPLRTKIFTSQFIER